MSLRKKKKKNEKLCGKTRILARAIHSNCAPPEKQSSAVAMSSSSRKTRIIIIIIIKRENPSSRSKAYPYQALSDDSRFYFRRYTHVMYLFFISTRTLFHNEPSVVVVVIVVVVTDIVRAAPASEASGFCTAVCCLSVFSPFFGGPALRNRIIRVDPQPDYHKYVRNIILNEY